jgi:hypothetical protein
MPDAGLALQQFAFRMVDRSPAVIGSAPFDFWFGEFGAPYVHDPVTHNARVMCTDLAWSAVLLDQPMPLATLTCYFNFQVINLDGTVTNFITKADTGTVTVTSYLDEVGNGSVVFQLDVTTDVVVTEYASDPPNQRSIRIETQGLRGEAVYGDIEVGGGFLII